MHHRQTSLVYPVIEEIAYTVAITQYAQNYHKGRFQLIIVYAKNAHITSVFTPCPKDGWRKL